MNRPVPRVYLSGPAALFPDGAERVRAAMELCRKYGFEPVAGAICDRDPAVPPQEDKRAAARRIQEATLERIASCDAILADCNEFRGGYQPYAGTSYELGYAYALGKRLYCYLMDTRSCGEKYGGQKHAYADGTPCDEEGRWFEPDCLNLMLWAPSTVVGGTLEAALQAAATDFFGEVSEQ